MVAAKIAIAGFSTILRFINVDLPATIVTMPNLQLSAGE